MQEIHNTPDLRVQLDNDGLPDEVVIGPGAWLHAEELDRDTRGYRYWHVILDGWVFRVRVSPMGRAIRTTVVHKPEDAR